jgi:hypothetical protein
MLVTFLISNTVCTGQKISWQWANRSEPPGKSEGRSTITDHDGNVIVIGNYYSASVTFNTVTLTSAGYGDIFVVKYDSSGNLLWAETYGGNLSESGNGISTDMFGNVYLTGAFSSSSITFGNTTLFKSEIDYPYSTAEFFIAKLDPDGNVIWAKNAEGTRYDEGDDIEIDAFGNIYVSGNAEGPIVFDHTLSLDGIGYFLAKFDKDGKIIWAKRSGSSLSESFGANSIALDLNGNIYFAGEHLINYYTNLSTEAFLTKFNSEGNVIWEKNFQGNGFIPYSAATGVTTDITGKVYIVGYYHQGISFNNVKLFSSGSFGNQPSIFIVKFDANGNTQWAESATKGRGFAMGVTAHKSGSVFVTGRLYLFGLNRDTLNFGNIYLESSIQDTSRDNTFIAQYNAEGKALWAYLIESEPSNESFGISSDPFGNVFITGRLNSNPNIPYETEMGPIHLSNVILQQSNSTSMFVAKLKPCQPPIQVIKLPVTICEGTSTVLASESESNNLWSTGSTNKSITVSASGSYGVIVSNIIGCQLSVTTTEVKVNPLPNASITASADSFCDGQSVIITASTGTHFLWNNGKPDQSIKVFTPGSYRVTITDKNNCASTSDFIQIKLNPQPPEIELFSGCSNLYIHDDYQVKWFKDDVVIIEATSNQKEIIPSDSGYFYVETSNVCGTSRSNGIHFKPAETRFIFLPNVITPNGDDRNEFFVLDEKLSGSDLLILNRWGGEVFHSFNYQNTWNGGDLSTGEYYYLIQNPCFNKPLKGTLSILK